jgi:hypothetical protein
MPGYRLFSCLKFPDGFNVGPDAILQAAKFGLLSGDDPTTLNLDALKL